MRVALSLAGRGLGRVWPNPAVGCLLVEGDGCESGGVVGRGWTQPGGRPHAETEALRRAGNAARGTTAYVTLEPCNHQGQTPPCSEALIKAGVTRVVAALRDPDPRTAGQGLETLSRAGIDVTEGVCEADAAELNAGFLLRVTKGRPLFTIKTATSLDGRIATHGGDSQWVTGDRARALGHQLRANHDAILVGIGTALTDNPSLTCRLPGLQGRSPLPVVLDSALRLPLDSLLVRRAKGEKVWVVCTERAAGDRKKALCDKGVEVIQVASAKDGRPDLRIMAKALGERGLTRVLVEGGGTVAGAFVADGLADRLAWFRAPRLIGGDGTPAFGTLGVDKLARTPYFQPSGRRQAEPDWMETYRTK
ncbi:bifunctional: diaminohydroxyphosphoribosylaminopyrimidine deaminase (N-terminal); 5-amino-6-(5-phosphoribosylamino) uracil reductase [Magnetospira sp. QH-2]|nr:bifunctional diaminohydroxyphosphoribosylaminopyrimidine deaminase/5-amino-6-(5-phosphoribosylamino)uracil reductase RibD [Magnetospira sp. QH-2]CCQ73830.1 bifunctional: diaminohydroxyphosphoribosylaminopyrimidine deaminase (N-terminal); 5-amino-6-(5-phosphoribosylamino) uracil reductase [Magnetospira sp. QH-2]